jgi:hypothetical protein
MDDLEVIRFVAMDMITDLNYHALPCVKSGIFAGPLLIGVPTFNLPLHPGILSRQSGYVGLSKKNAWLKGSNFSRPSSANSAGSQ